MTLCLGSKRNFESRLQYHPGERVDVVLLAPVAARAAAVLAAEFQIGALAGVAGAPVVVALLFGFL